MPRDVVSTLDEFGFPLPEVPKITAATPGAVYVPTYTYDRGNARVESGGYYRLPSAQESGQIALAALPQDIKNKIATEQLTPEYEQVWVRDGRGGEGYYENGKLTGFSSVSPDDIQTSYDLEGNPTGTRHFDRSGGIIGQITSPLVYGALLAMGGAGLSGLLGAGAGAGTLGAAEGALTASELASLPGAATGIGAGTAALTIPEVASLGSGATLGSLEGGLTAAELASLPGAATGIGAGTAGATLGSLEGGLTASELAGLPSLGTTLGATEGALTAAEMASLPSTAAGATHLTPAAKSVNEMIASGAFTPGSAGTIGAAEGLLTAEQLAAASGVVTEGATPALFELGRAGKGLPSPNEMVASGTSPGAAGAAGAAAGQLTPAELAAAYGVSTAGSATAGLTSSMLDKLKDATGLSADQLKALVGGAGGLLAAYEANQPKLPTGYQGGIPAYTAVQGRAAEPAAGSRPGAGHQYFTGVKFAPAAGLPAAKAAVDAQVADANKLNADNELARSPIAKAEGGIMGLARGGKPTHPQGTYLRGDTDGMADKIPGTIDGVQPARLAHGEFVIPADVVSHLGNGNSDAGAKQLYKMMDRIRTARTGTSKQGKEINPSKFMPGGLASYAPGGEVTKPAIPATATGTESNLSNWAGPYVTDLLGKTQALTSAALETPQFYQGELTAGPSALQNKAYDQAGTLTGQSFTNAGTAGTYMSPYMQNVVDIQKREAQRQSGIQGTQQQAQAAQAGAFGGGRDAIMRAERERNLGTQMNDIQAQGLQSAYQAAQNQYNTEQNKNLANINVLSNLGNTQQLTEQAGLTAAQAQFEQQKADPYKQLQFQQSMLQNMPLQAQSYNTTTNPLAAAAAGATGTSDIFNAIFKP